MWNVIEDKGENISRTAKAVAICEMARSLTEEQVKIMNLVILVDNTQMFFRNFGHRHVIAALGKFGIELAGPKAGRIIVALFSRPADWLRLRPGQ